jgi:hypothetical protein
MALSPRHRQLLMQPVCGQGWSAFSPSLSKPLCVHFSSSTTIYQACDDNIHRTSYRPIHIVGGEEYREGGGIWDTEGADWEGL